MSCLRFDIWEKINIFEAILIGLLLENHLLLPKYDSKSIVIKSTGGKKGSLYRGSGLAWNSTSEMKRIFVSRTVWDFECHI